MALQLNWIHSSTISAAAFCIIGLTKTPFLPPDWIYCSIRIMPGSQPLYTGLFSSIPYQLHNAYTLGGEVLASIDMREFIIQLVCFVENEVW